MHQPQKKNTLPVLIEYRDEGGPLPLEVKADTVIPQREACLRSLKITKVTLALLVLTLFS